MSAGCWVNLFLIISSSNQTRTERLLQPRTHISRYLFPCFLCNELPVQSWRQWRQCVTGYNPYIESSICNNYSIGFSSLLIKRAGKTLHYKSVHNAIFVWYLFFFISFFMTRSGLQRVYWKMIKYLLRTSLYNSWSCTNLLIVTFDLVNKLSLMTVYCIWSSFVDPSCRDLVKSSVVCFLSFQIS